VLLDFGGTLDADGITWKARFARLCAEERLPVAPEQFDAAFYAADDALVGTVPPTLAFEETISRLTTALTRSLGGDDETSRRVAERFLDDAVRTLNRNVALLSRLRRRYRLGIVSNFYGNLATVCHNAGIDELFSVIVDSACVGCSKPDRRIFQTALDALELGPADAVFVGDSLPRDMAGARAMGMRHIWLAGEAAREAVSCCPGDPIVHSFTELESVLL
jgi:putative hydrolase of the HAD superfamily